MVLKDAASRARSSSPRGTMRSCSRPDDSRCATMAACRTGRTTCRVTMYATPPTRSTSAIPPPMRLRRTRLMVSCSRSRLNTKYSSYSPAIGTVTREPIAMPGVLRLDPV